MPRKKINRSQAIRDYLAKNAGASVSEINGRAGQPALETWPVCLK